MGIHIEPNVINFVCENFQFMYCVCCSMPKMFHSSVAVTVVAGLFALLSFAKMSACDTRDLG